MRSNFAGNVPGGKFLCFCLVRQKKIRWLWVKLLKTLQGIHAFVEAKRFSKFLKHRLEAQSAAFVLFVSFINKKTFKSAQNYSAFHLKITISLILYNGGRVCKVIMNHKTTMRTWIWHLNLPLIVHCEITYECSAARVFLARQCQRRTAACCQTHQILSVRGLSAVSQQASVRLNCEKLMLRCQEME